MSFEVGQKWTIKDSGMTIVVGKVEPFEGDKNQTTVSISVFDMPCPPQMGQKTVDVSHVPFDSEALMGSVDRLVDSHAQPSANFADGYKNWKNSKGGGVFTMPVTQLAEFLFQE